MADHRQGKRSKIFGSAHNSDHKPRKSRRDSIKTSMHNVGKKKGKR